MNDDAQASGGISLLALQEATLAAISTITGEIQAVLDADGMHDAFAQTIAGLVHYMSARSQAVLMLTTWSFPWDAEIILRSFYEAAAKILYLTLSPKDRRNDLLQEFWLELDSIHTMRRSRKADHTSAVPGSSEVSNMIFAALKDPELWDLTHRHNKAKRKEIEQRWSFTELVDAIAKLETHIDNLKHIKALHYMYGLASHLAHADNTALDLVKDRSMRPEPERSIVAAAQAGRIFSDLVHLWWLSADSISRAIGQPLRSLSSIQSAMQTVNELGEPFKIMFEDSQRSFYERMRNAKRD